MTCSTSDNTLNPPVSPGINVPGFGPVSSPVQLPLDLANLPSQIVESLQDLSDAISAQFPSGTYKANPDHNFKTVLDFIANVMTQLAPALGTYNFFIALLKLPICIIEVLCAIPNPFAMAAKIKKLFQECIPPYLALFPISALIVMIISLLLLIIALIEYIITLIITIIDDIINNLQVLSSGAALNDAEATLAAANKIAGLLCDMENIFSIFTALAAILAVIEELAKVGGFLICSDDDTDGCCADNICPDFIRTTPNGINVPLGTLKYTSQIGADLSSSLPPSLAGIITIPPLREERWQLFSSDPSPQFPIKLIITETQDQIFWPDPLEFESDLSLKKAPYTVDITLTIDPSLFGQTGLAREFVIKDCIVVRKPYIGVYNYDNSIGDTPSTGTLNVEGGLVYELDGVTPVEIAGEQATLNTFLHLSSSSATALPVSDDSLTFTNVNFTWKPNAAALAGYQLTTIGCIPEVSVEKAVQNSLITEQGLDPIIDTLAPVPAGTIGSTGNFLPNVPGAQACLSAALTNFRGNVSIENAAVLQASLTTCLNDLKNQSIFTLCNALENAVSRYQSSIEVSPDLQFVTKPIQVEVKLKNNNGINIGVGIPIDCSESLAADLSGEVTLGTISAFSYQPDTSSFIAKITSGIAGDGTVQVSYKGQVFSVITPGVVGGSSSSISEKNVGYTFVDANADPMVRRDAGDVGRA